MLRYSPILFLASPESIVYSYPIGGGIWVDLVFPLEWPLWISQHLFYLHFHLQNTTPPPKTQTQEFYTFFSKITFTLVYFLPRGNDLGIPPSKTRPQKSPCDWGAFLCIHASHLHHLFFLSYCPFLLTLSQGSVTLPSRWIYITHTLLGIVLKGLGKT